MTRMSTVKVLHTALSSQQIVLHYQPVVESSSGRTRKGETLMRWLHPQKGLPAPERFIGIAEETRLINEIGDRVHREASRRVSQW